MIQIISKVDFYQFKAKAKGSGSLFRHPRGLPLRLLLASVPILTSACQTPEVRYGDSEGNGSQSPEHSAASGPSGLSQDPDLASRSDLLISSRLTQVSLTTPHQKPSQGLVAPPEVTPPELILFRDKERVHLKLPEDLTRLWTEGQGLFVTPGQCLLVTKDRLGQMSQKGEKPDLPSVSRTPYPSEFRVFTEASGPSLGPTPLLQSQMIIISEADSPKVLGLARSNDKGRFQCPGLPPREKLTFATHETLRVSTDPERPQETTLLQSALGKAVVRITAAPATPGDTRTQATPKIWEQGLWLRIARRTQTPTDSNSWSTPTQAPWSWLRKNSTASPGLRIESYFQPTFLIPSERTEIALPQGPYLLALTHPETNLTCYLFAEVRSGESTELSCPEAKFSTDSLSRDFKARERRDSPLTLLLPTQAAGETLKMNLEKLPPLGVGFAELNIIQDSAVVHVRPRIDSGPSQSPSETTAARTMATGVDARKEQIVLDQAFTDMNDLSKTELRHFEAYLAGRHIPDLVLGSQLAAQGNEAKTFFNPLYSQTRLALAQDRMLTAESMHTVMTNGVTFRWQSLDPTSSLVPMPADGVLSFSVIVPAYNLTEFVEIHVNGLLKRRLVLARKNISEAIVVPVEQRLESDSDAEISIFAWGRPYLPEFLYGQDSIAPRALFSRICLDANKNSICDLLSERPTP